MQLAPAISPRHDSPARLHLELRSFFEFDRATGTDFRQFADIRVPVYENEFWTAKQRQGHSIQEVSYRACYKPQLPAFFIQRFCHPDDVVYDPFMGRGTTLIEAQLHGCRAIGNDVNPVCRVLAGPRLHVPTEHKIQDRVSSVKLGRSKLRNDLLVFFHAETLAEICGWRDYFHRRREEGTFDHTDAWIEMVACNRLTGHSMGFFSVYTLPPNQAVSVESQRRINEKRQQQPAYRDTKALILRKTNQLLRRPLPKNYNRGDAMLLCASADNTHEIPDESVKLVVTSPPFLDTVDYLQDNWLRMWFCQITAAKDEMWQLRSLEQWLAKMTCTFRELARVLRSDGVIAFEVGEIRNGVLLLENEVIKAAFAAGLVPECVMINSQNFTKTANCWGVANNQNGTNSNRIVVLRKSRG